MSYLDDTFRIIWRFNSTDGEEYLVVSSKNTNSYELYRFQDVQETSYTNYEVKKNYAVLNGSFNELLSPCFVSVSNNLIHSSIGPAALVPHGLEVFHPKEIVEHYLIYGKLMSQYSWLTWVKNGPTWPQVMANLLGSKNPE